MNDMVVNELDLLSNSKLHDSRARITKTLKALHDSKVVAGLLAGKQIGANKANA